MSFLWWDQCSYKKMTMRSLSPRACTKDRPCEHTLRRPLSTSDTSPRTEFVGNHHLTPSGFQKCENYMLCLSCPVFGILLQQPEETKTRIILQRYIDFGGKLDYWGIGIFGSSISMFSHQKSIRNIKVNIDKIWKKFWLSSGQDRLEGVVRSLVYNKVKSL